MKWEYYLTFERINDPPVTVRGIVEGSTFATAAQRAVKDARKKTKRVRADSISMVIQRPEEDMVAEKDPS